ncbi:MAG: 4'-phosphopantetheinyl transferase superfamily protein [Flavobacteriaceae bacterium]
MDDYFNLEYRNVHVWHAKLDLTSDTLKEYNELLSDDEKKKSGKFRFLKDQKKFIASRGILRVLSGHYLNTDPEKIIFKYGEYGKPEFDFPTQLKFNISHSENMIVLGFVKNDEIGVDVEKIKNNFNVIDIAQSFFSFEEINKLESLPENEQCLAFYRCWTRKESFIKAKGSGLSFPLDSFTVSLDTNEDAELLETKWNSSEKKSWKMFSYTPAENYIGALSVQGDIRSVRYWNWEAFMGENE